MSETSSTTPFAAATSGQAKNKIHHYPLFLEGSASSQGHHSKEQAREVIQFTAIRQPGITFKKEAEDAVRKRNQDALNARIAKDEKSISDTKQSFNKILENFGQTLENMTNIPTAQAEQIKASTVSKLKSSLGERKTGGNGETTTISNILEAKNLGEVGLAAKAQLLKQSQRLEDCFLYMPSSVVYNEGAAWQKEEIGFTGNALSNMLKGQKSIGDMIGEFGAGLAIPAGRAAAVGLSAFVAGKIGGILTVIGAGGIDKGLLKTSRLAQNPYEEQLFSGIDFRSFAFNFDFVAVSEKEYQAVMDIIKMFRSHSRPSFAIEGGNQALYSYPNEFAITFLHLDAAEDNKTQNIFTGQYVENPNLPKLHNCVLTNITTDYAPDGWQAHSQGEPNAISMQLQFTETIKNTREFIDAERNNGGGY